MRRRVTDDIYYRTIGAELENGPRDPGAWAQALAEANGDPDRTKAAYIRLRLQALKKAAVFAAAQRLEQGATGGDDRIGRIRSALAMELPAARIGNFYDALGVEPDATDEEVARAIRDREAEIERGTAVRSPVFNYAKEALGKPQARAVYDEKLYEQLRRSAEAPARSISDDAFGRPEGVFLPWWETRKVTAIIGIAAVAVVGYLLLAFMQERGGREVQKASIEVRKTSLEAQGEALRAAAENERARVENERRANESQIAVVDKAIERSAELQNRALSIQAQEQERRQQELEYRANAGAQILELQRERQQHQIAMERQRRVELEEQEERLRAERQRRYWACMNAALDRVDSARANAQCAGFR